MPPPCGPDSWPAAALENVLNGLRGRKPWEAPLLSWNYLRWLCAGGRACNTCIFFFFFKFYFIFKLYITVLDFPNIKMKQ